MNEFVIKALSNTDIEREMADIGYDNCYIHKGKDKFFYKNFKIFSLTCAQANIIKQLALSVGADCATNKNVITGKIEKSDCIMGGNVSQLRIIAQKLQLQPFGLKDLGKIIEDKISCSEQKIKTKIVGILNLTQNSFSDGGKYFEFDKAIEHLHELLNDGADIIDIGAESTKPYSEPVSAQNQLEKIVPVLEYIRKNDIKIPISIDTRSALVACECIKLGASIVNDVSGLDYDENMADAVANNPNVKIVIQHSKGTPETMQQNPCYDNLTDEIFLSLNKKINFAMSKGIKKENIIIDAGIGFGKTRADNFEIMRRWQEFRSLGCGVMLGLSRKSLLDMPDASNDEKDVYSLALGAILINDGIDYIRVHNVKLHKNLVNMLYGTGS